MTNGTNDRPSAPCAFLGESLAGLVATEESLKRIWIDRLARKAAEARKAAGLPASRSLAPDVATGLARAIREYTPVPLPPAWGPWGLTNALRAWRYPVKPDPGRYTARLMEQRDILGHGRRRVTRGASNNEGHHDFGADAAVKSDLLFVEAGEKRGYSVVEYSQGWLPSGPGLPYSADEVRAAVKARRHRTGKQELILDTFRVYLAHYRPRSEAVAEALGCGLRSIKRYRQEGKVMLAEAIAAEVATRLETTVREAVREEGERQMTSILAALRIDVAAEAERILAIEA